MGLLPFCQVEIKAKKPKSSACPKTLTTLGDHIRKRRLDLGLYQKDVAATLGVNDSSLTNWEKGHSSPHLSFLPKIISFLGYVPPPYNKKTDNIVEMIRLYRLTHGLSQEKLAKLVGVDETTVASWEQGGQKPSEKLTAKLSAFLDDLGS